MTSPKGNVPGRLANRRVTKNRAAALAKFVQGQTPGSAGLRDYLYNRWTQELLLVGRANNDSLKAAYRAQVLQEIADDFNFDLKKKLLDN